MNKKENNAGDDTLLRIHSGDAPESFDNNPDLPPIVQHRLRALKELLSAFLLQIDGSENLLYAAIIQPLARNGFMRGIISQHIPSSHLVSHHDFDGGIFLHNIQLTGKRPFKSIAGKVATELKPIFIPDLKDEMNEHVRDFLVLSPSRPSGGILAVPILHSVDGRSRCIAVVSITATERNFLTEQHVLFAEEFAEEIRLTVIKLLTDLQPYLEVTEHHSSGMHNIPSMSENVSNKESLPNQQQSEDCSSLDNLIRQAFSAIVEQLRPHNRSHYESPTKQEQILEVFEQHLGELVPPEKLSPIFNGSSNPKLQAQKSIKHLNDKLTASKNPLVQRIRIRHVSGYRVELLSDGLNSP
jgi:hypothetical protein